MRLYTLFKNIIEKFNNRTKDYIIEQKINGIWYYRKYNSGIVELWGADSRVVSHYTTTLGGIAPYGYSYVVNFPFTLYKPIDCHFNVRVGTGISYVMDGGVFAKGVKNVSSMQFSWQASHLDAQSTFNIYIMALWKDIEQWGV